MATYIPNATQLAEPVESRTVESAALEFRTLKTSINERLDAETDARVAGDDNLQTQASVQAERIKAIEAALLAFGDGAGMPGTVYVQRLTGTGAQTAFTLNVSVPAAALIDVFINGVYQNKDTFTIVGDVLTFSEAPPAGTNNVEVVISITLANVETDASLVSFRATDSTAVVRTAQDKMREVVSVRDFGAVGDGVADDTAAIQAALNSGAGAVQVPVGAYKFSSTLTIPPNTHFFGMHGLARKYNSSTAACRLVYDGVDLIAIKFANDANGIGASKISNIVIAQSSDAVGVVAVQIGSAADLIPYTLSTALDNILIEDFTGNGVYNYASWNCTLTDVLVHGRNSPNRTAVGFHLDSSASGSTSCYLTNCAAEECDVGFRIGSSTSGNLYAYSSLVNTYVDGCTTAYEFLGTGTNTRAIHVFNAGIEAVSGGNAVLADGTYVAISGLSMFANGPGFSYVIEARNGALLTIENADAIPQTGFGGASSVAIVRADNAIVRFLNSDVTDATGEISTVNGGRVDQINKDQQFYRNLERVATKTQDLTVSTRDSTYSGYKQYNLYTTAGANQVMAGTPIINTSGVDDGEIITIVNVDSAYEFVLRTEDILANTGIVKHPDNVSASGVVIQKQDYAQFVKKSDGKLYEIKRFA